MAPQLRRVALDRAIRERSDPLTDLDAPPRGFALRGPAQAHGTAQPVDRAGRDAPDTGRLDHRREGLLGRPGAIPMTRRSGSPSEASRTTARRCLCQFESCGWAAGRPSPRTTMASFETAAGISASLRPTAPLRPDPGLTSYAACRDARAPRGACVIRRAARLTWMPRIPATRWRAARRVDPRVPRAQSPGHSPGHAASSASAH